MNCDTKLRELVDQMKDLEAKMEELISVTIDEEEFREEPARRRVGGARSFSVAACVTKGEKKQLDALCDEYSEKQGWRIRRGALLRLVWLYFLDNHEDIDLEPYKD